MGLLGYARANLGTGSIGRLVSETSTVVQFFDLFVEAELGLECFRRLGRRSSVTIPNNLFPLPSLLPLFFLSSLSFSLIHVVTKDICTGGSKVFEGGDDIGTLLELLRLGPSEFELFLLLFPFGIKKLDTHVFSELIFRDGLTTIGTNGSGDSVCTLNTYTGLETHGPMSLAETHLLAHNPSLSSYLSAP